MRASLLDSGKSLVVLESDFITKKCIFKCKPSHEGLPSSRAVGRGGARGAVAPPKIFSIGMGIPRATKWHKPEVSTLIRYRVMPPFIITSFYWILPL